jgi:glycosyltransferase involved in cell wall biosynthesis
MTLDNQVTLYLVIPCFNEAQQIVPMLASLPSALSGVHELRVLVVDDGSTDNSVILAKYCSVEVLELAHVGLAQAYGMGLRAALDRGADMIVTLDADGQYDPSMIGHISDILQTKQADIVLAERDQAFYAHMSFWRRTGHRMGRWVVRQCTGLPIRDPVSGYRGYSRQAAGLLQIRSRYSYTLETLVQIPILGLRLTTVQTSTNPSTRPSRLFRHPVHYVLRQALTLLWAIAYYRWQNFAERRAFLKKLNAESDEQSIDNKALQR